MRGSKAFCQRGSNFDKGREDPNTIISGPSSSRKRHAIYMAFRWREDDGLTMNAGLVAVIFRGSGPELLRNPIFCDILVFFSEGVRANWPSSGSAQRALVVTHNFSHWHYYIVLVTVHW